jgi:hypothetical protein
MRKTFSGLAFAILALSAAPSIMSWSAVAYAQEPPSPSIYANLKQTALTEAQVTQYLAAQKEMEAVFASAPANAGDKVDPATLAKLEAVAKKHQFASYDDFNAVAGNIAIVLDGVDDDTKKYVGPEAVIKKTIAEVKSDAKMSDADKKQQVAELEAELKQIVPLKFPANIPVVLKFYDKLSEVGQPSK